MNGLKKKNKCVCVYVDGWMDRQVCSYPDCFFICFSLDYFIILITHTKDTGFDDMLALE